MKSVFVVAIFGALIGCGDNHHNNNPDASIPSPDAPPPDAEIDGGPQPLHCDYTEQRDTSNDYRSTGEGYMIEDTGIHFAPGASKTICGAVNDGHYDLDGFQEIDIDNYLVTVDSDSDVLVTLTSAGAGVAAAAKISEFGIFSFSDQAMATVGAGFYATDHSAFSVHLTAGTYELSVEAYDNQDAPTSFPYKLNIATDNPTQRCATFTGTATYTEKNEATNDALVINSNGFTIQGSPTPELTGITLASGSDYLVTGSSIPNDSIASGSSYFDLDTYQITTDLTTNQLSVRLDWSTAGVDLDYYLFPGGHNFPIVTASTISTTGPEFGTSAVVPSTSTVTQTYWLSVGAATDSTAGNLPAAYSATICAEQFVPPPQ